MFIGVIGGITWLILAVVLGNIAGKKGRSFGAFFAAGLFLSPLIGFIILLAMGDNKEALDKQKSSSGIFKKCPYCANEIKREATICQFCNKEVPTFIPTHKVKLLTQSDGLSLRKEPSSNNDAFLKLPNGTEIELLETGDVIKFNNLSAPWFKVITKDGIIGWCFSGSLEKL